MTLEENFGINDAPFVVQPIISGKKIPHPAYVKWSNSLHRFYSASYQQKYPTYTGVTCVVTSGFHSVYLQNGLK